MAAEPRSVAARALSGSKDRRGVVARSRKGGRRSPRGKVAEIQRARLLNATVSTVDELGWTRVTVAHITGYARVSRLTFYEMFANREDCLLAVFDDTVALVGAELATLDRGVLSWREYVRAGLADILAFLDREPALARVCVVQSAAGGERVLDRRAELCRRLGEEIDAARHESARAREIPPLVAEGLVGAALAIVYKRLSTSEPTTPLSDLLGELMAMIVLPYLGPAAARQERARPAPRPVMRLANHDHGSVSGLVRPDPLAEVPMRLTYRTARVLEDIATHPGTSNRLVADHAGITDQGQVSKLLARLERIGLLHNSGRGQARGERNEWSLTPLGERVTHSIAINGGHTQGRTV